MHFVSCPASRIPRFSIFFAARVDPIKFQGGVTLKTSCLFNIESSAFADELICCMRESMTTARSYVLVVLATK